MSIFNLFTKEKVENKYHKFLKIPIDPKIDLFAKKDYDPLFYRHLSLDKNEINPELIDWFESLGIKFHLYEAFYTPPYGGKIPVHTDTPLICDVGKINWTYGAPGSKLLFWQAKDKKYINKKQTEFNHDYLFIDEKHAKKVFEAEIKKPSLVNIGQFHSTYNPTSEGRWTLSLPLSTPDNTRRLEWQECIEKLTPYFDDE